MHGGTPYVIPIITDCPSFRNYLLKKLFILLRSYEVVNDGSCEQNYAYNEQDGAVATQHLSNVTQYDTNAAEVSIGESSGSKAQVTHYRHGEYGQEGDQQAVDEGTYYAALQTAVGVSEYTGGSTAEEVRYYAGQDDRQGVTKARVDTQQDEHTYDTTNEGYQETDQNCVRSIRECNGAVDGRYSTGNQLIRDTLESGNYFSQDQTYQTG